MFRPIVSSQLILLEGQPRVPRKINSAIAAIFISVIDVTKLEVGNLRLFMTRTNH